MIYGYLYVPNGEVHVGGSNNFSWTGIVIGDEIDVNGTGSGGGIAGGTESGGTGTFVAVRPSLRDRARTPTIS